MLQIKKGGIQQKLKLPTVKYCKHSLLSEDIINVLLKKRRGEKSSFIILQTDQLCTLYILFWLLLRSERCLNYLCRDVRAFALSGDAGRIVGELYTVQCELSRFQADKR